MTEVEIGIRRRLIAMVMDLEVYDRCGFLAAVVRKFNDDELRVLAMAWDMVIAERKEAAERGERAPLGQRLN